uniref:Selenoprotein T n=1 Tax=Trypanosoma congolense (strain IL3000) TaxID=1068625 RepID=G0UMF6_TRYCI|nr:conserved hypothetical protein [Trypanosoma congolense IL3000]
MIGGILSTGFVLLLIVSVLTPFLRGVIPPHIAQWIEQHRYTILGVGFVMNIISANLLQSGAFEVYLDGVLVYSKLETNTVPSAGTLAKHILQKIIEANAAGGTVH